jgi:hypothetical protein
MKSVQDFIKTVDITKIPTVSYLDEICKKFSNMSEMSDQIKIKIYLEDMYNATALKIQNIELKGGKKSRRQKHKKRNTLKRGGMTIDYTGVVTMLIIVGTLLACCNKPNNTRREDGWNIPE